MEFNANLVGISFNIAVTNIVFCAHFKKMWVESAKFCLIHSLFNPFRNSTIKANKAKTASSTVEAFKFKIGWLYKLLETLSNVCLHFVSRAFWWVFVSWDEILVSSCCRAPHCHVVEFNKNVDNQMFFLNSTTTNEIWWKKEVRFTWRIHPDNANNGKVMNRQFLFFCCLKSK